jgi:hypothetical protein
MFCQFSPVKSNLRELCRNPFVFSLSMTKTLSSKKSIANSNSKNKLVGYFFKYLWDKVTHLVITYINDFNERKTNITTCHIEVRLFLQEKGKSL